MMGEKKGGIQPKVLLQCRVEGRVGLHNSVKWIIALMCTKIVDETWSLCGL